MANEIALHILVRPGHLVVCEARSHVSGWRRRRPPRSPGSPSRGIHAPRGLLTAERSPTPSRPDPYDVDVVDLVSVENTHQVGGGSVMPLDELRGIRKVAPRRPGSAVYLDGARIFNAGAASGAAVERVRRRGRRADVLPVEGPRRADRLGAVRTGRVHPRGPPGARSCSAGRGGRPGCWPRPGWSRSRRARAGCTRTTPTPGAWPRASPRSPPGRSTRRRWRPTSCSWTPRPSGSGRGRRATGSGTQGVLVTVVAGRVRMLTHRDVTAADVDEALAAWRRSAAEAGGGGVKLFGPRYPRGDRRAGPARASGW